MATETIERDGITYHRAGIIVDGIVYLAYDGKAVPIASMAQRVAEIIQRRSSGMQGVGRTGPVLVNAEVPAHSHQKTKPAYNDGSADQPER